MRYEVLHPGCLKKAATHLLPPEIVVNHCCGSQDHCQTYSGNLTLSQDDHCELNYFQIGVRRLKGIVSMGIRAHAFPAFFSDISQVPRTGIGKSNHGSQNKYSPPPISVQFQSNNIFKMFLNDLKFKSNVFWHVNIT